jgi:hypothetical protein
MHSARRFQYFAVGVGLANGFFVGVGVGKIEIVDVGTIGGFVDVRIGVGVIYFDVFVGVNIEYVFVAVASLVGVRVKYGVIVKVGVGVLTCDSFEDKSGGFVNVG